MFFIGNRNVDATSYRYCEYRIDAGTLYGDEGKTLPHPSYVHIMLKNGHLVSMSIADWFKNEYEYYERLVLSRQTTTANDRYDFKIWLDIFERQLDHCPQTLKAKRAYNLRDNNDDIHGEFTLKKTVDTSYSTNLQPLSCSYKVESTIEGALIPYHNDGDKRVNNNITFTFTFDDLEHPSVSVEGDYESDTTSFNNTLLAVINEKSYLTERRLKNQTVDDEWIYSSYVYLLDALKNRECPAYVTYYKKWGYYISSGPIGLQESHPPDLAGQDQQYSIYKPDYSNYCKEKKGKYDNVLNQLDSSILGSTGTRTGTIPKIESELDTYIANKNLTQEKYEEFKNELSSIEKGLSGETGSPYAILGDIETDFKQDTGRCYEYDPDYYTKMTNAVEALRDKISGSSDIYKKLQNAIQDSTALTQEQKEANQLSLQQLMEQINEGFKKLKLSNIDQKQDCTSIFNFDTPGSFGSMLQSLFNMVKIIAPILVILFGALDFGKAVIASDQDALKKAQSNFVKRCIAAVALFFLPMLINLILEIIDSNFTSCNLK